MKNFLAKVGIAVLIAAACLATASPAQASPEQDQSIYDAMYDEGVVLFPSAYGQARRACGLIWQGYDPQSIVSAFQGINPNWTSRQVTMFVAYSIAIYCPLSSSYSAPSSTPAPAPSTTQTPRGTTV